MTSCAAACLRQQPPPQPATRCSICSCAQRQPARDRHTAGVRPVHESGTGQHGRRQDQVGHRHGGECPEPLLIAPISKPPPVLGCGWHSSPLMDASRASATLPRAVHVRSSCVMTSASLFASISCSSEFVLITSSSEQQVSKRLKWRTVAPLVGLASVRR